MKKDIEMPKVEGVEVAVVKEETLGDDNWKVYLLNKNNFPIDNVLVSSKGYGKIKGEQRKTSILRHMIGRIDARDYALIEPIDSQVLVLTNEYWVSYYVGRKIYDKKYVFLAESITDDNLIDIGLIGKRGVLHA